MVGLTLLPLTAVAVAACTHRPMSGSKLLQVRCSDKAEKYILTSGENPLELQRAERSAASTNAASRPWGHRGVLSTFGPEFRVYFEGSPPVLRLSLLCAADIWFRTLATPSATTVNGPSPVIVHT